MAQLLAPHAPQQRPAGAALGLVPAGDLGGDGVEALALARRTTARPAGLPTCSRDEPLEDLVDERTLVERRDEVGLGGVVDGADARTLPRNERNGHAA